MGCAECGGILFLIGVSITDLRSKKIPLPVPVFFGAAGIFGQIYLYIDGRWSVGEAVIGILPGILIAVLAALSDSAGMGDAVCLTALGLLEGSAAAGVFLGGILLMCVVSIVLLLAGRVSRKSRLPFMPFLLISQVLYCLLMSERGV